MSQKPITQKPITQKPITQLVRARTAKCAALLLQNKREVKENLTSLLSGPQWTRTTDLTLIRGAL